MRFARGDGLSLAKSKITRNDVDDDDDDDDDERNRGR
jgi:hypothetical protein